jgi:hypothetical protein
LQEEDGALGGAAPHKLAAFSLAILNVYIAAGIFQAAILELAIYEDAVVENHVLVFKRLVLKSVHDRTLYCRQGVTGFLEARPPQSNVPYMGAAASLAVQYEAVDRMPDARPPRGE